LFRSKREKPLIEFYTQVPGLAETKELHPQPAHKFIPQWWKTLPKQQPYPEQQTVKVCPSFPDFFSQGYIIPMWTDLAVSYDKKTGRLEWLAGRPGPNNPFRVEPHTNDQFLDYVDADVRGNPVNFVFKVECPWMITTPKGYSVLQLPLFYHYENNFSVLPGITHTDMFNQVNQQVTYHGDGEYLTIKRGTPFVQYIPFKRTKYDIDVRRMTEDDTSKAWTHSYNLTSKFLGSGAYKSKFMKHDKESDV
jgi:hypothetical protein